MKWRRLSMLPAIAAAVALAAVACDKQSPDDEPKAEARETAQREAPAEPGADDESGDESDETPESDGPPTSLDELPDGVNAVQHEMRLLNTAMQNTLTLIANDNLEAIPGQIKKVHPARQLTMKALEQGKYEPPVNADQMDEFGELDEQFHQDLKGLLKASKEDDLKGATEQYGKLVSGCTNCHTQFRFESRRGPAGR